MLRGRPSAGRLFLQCTNPGIRAKSFQDKKTSFAMLKNS